MRDLPASGPLRCAVAGLLLGAVLLSGCSEKTEANNTLPPASAAPTTEALPPVGPVDFPVPDEARTKDAAGAEAFLRYWIDLLNRQRAIPAGEPLRALGPDCQNCQRIAQNFDEAAAAGYRYEGGAITIDDVADPSFEGDGVEISFLARQEAVQRRDATGTPIDPGQMAAEGLSSGIALTWSSRDETWVVTGFDLG